jgi:putative ABC transport system permease protein
LLVIGEFALALALLTGAGLAIHSFWNLTKVDLGTSTTNIQTFSLACARRAPQRSGAMINATTNR